MSLSFVKGQAGGNPPGQGGGHPHLNSDMAETFFSLVQSDKNIAKKCNIWEILGVIFDKKFAEMVKN